MKYSLKWKIAMYVCQLLWSPLMRRFLVFVPPLKEASLWLKGLYNLLFENMENVVFQQMEGHGIRKHAYSQMLNIIFILRFKKYHRKNNPFYETKPNALTAIFHARKILILG